MQIHTHTHTHAPIASLCNKHKQQPLQDVPSGRCVYVQLTTPRRDCENYALFLSFVPRGDRDAG